MKAIDFVVRTGAGETTRGEISQDQAVTAINAGGGVEVSLNLRQSDLNGYQRAGDNLEIVLADGRVVVLEGYFSQEGGADSRLFVSADGYLNEVDLVEGSEGVLYAQYGPTEQWGKWSPSDDLIFLGGTDVMNAAVAADSEVSMLGAGLLAGPGLWGVGAGAAVLGGGVLGGGDTGSVHIAATVNESGVITIGGDGTTDADRTVTITGRAEPDSEVTVTIGGETVVTVSDADGNWTTTFVDDTFPGEGEFIVDVHVVEPDGTIVDLVGPTLDVDTIGPVVEFTDGVDSTGDLFNAVTHAGGVDLSGTGEIGASLVVTVGGFSHTTVVGADGTWTVTFPTTELAGGEYSSTVTIVASDDAGNTTTITDTVVIDTIPDPIVINTATFEGDGTMNGSEAADGFTVTGTSNAGVTITVDIDGVSQDVVVASDGTWSATYDTSALPGGEYDATITATTTDAAGNSNTVTGTVRIDTIGHVAIDAALVEGDDVINAAEASDGVTLTGTSEAGSTVSVTFGGVSHNATVAADGSWSVDFAASEIASGEYNAEFSVTATDGAGNVSTTSRSVRVDTTTGVTIDTGLAGGDDLVNAAEAATGVTLTGTAEVGSSVQVTLGSVTHTATVDSSGNWSADFAAGDIPAGTYTSAMTVVSTDGAGNTQTVSGDLDIDTLSFVAFDNVSVEGDDVVNAVEVSDGVTLTGTTQPGSTVNVTVEGTTHAATVDAAGNWTVDFAASEIPAGTYDTTASVTSTGPSGNTSTATDTFRVDTEANVAFSATPVEGDDIINAAEAADGVTLTGTTDPGSTVEVTFQGVTHSATVAADGGWSVDFTASEIPAGEYNATLTAVATDAAGNVVTATDTVRVDTDAGRLTLSSAPIEGDGTINAVEASDGVPLTGTSNPGAIVAVTLGSVTHSVVTDGAGNWSAFYAAGEIPQGTYDAAITATTTDTAGNTLTETGTVHVDTVVENLSVSIAPIEGDNVINEAELADGFSVSGTVEVGSTVNVTIEGVTHAATVDSSGNWTVDFVAGDLPAGEYSSVIDVAVTDVAGNTATTSRSVDVDTLVNTLANSTTPVEGDDVVNADEASDGVTLNGQVEQGSSVIVNFAGTDYVATVNGSGAWTVDIPASGIAAGTYDAAIVVSATDAAGNTRSINDTLSIDTEAPDGPVIDSYTRDITGTRGISTDMTSDNLTVTEVAADGTLSDVSGTETDIVAINETLFSFDTTVPDGSHLVVTSEDAAGNVSGTYLVLDETATSNVELSNAGLGAYQIETVDLQFADDSNLTITEADLLALSSNSDTLVVTGGTDDSVTAIGAVNTGTTTTIDGQIHDVYTLGSTGTLIIDDDITVVI
ncbi:MAG: Ig-like domain-containing protein [Rhodobacterales bacterium]|nr:Ig-like domain-containing protein [Rhodobacterales bacterium]